MTRKTVLAFAAVAAVAPLLASCAQYQPATAPTRAVTTAPKPSAAPTPTLASPLPSVASPTPRPTRTTTQAPRTTRTTTKKATTTATRKTATPVKKTSAKPTRTPEPALPAGQCGGEVLKHGGRGACAKEAQRLLKAAGTYGGAVDGKLGTGSINAVLNYQRSRGLPDTGVIASQTWAALYAKKPALAASIPARCRTAGTVLCASKAQRKLYVLKNGVVQKTVRVRFGGYTDQRDGTMRVHHTVSGSYRVYNKNVNPSSLRYGEGAMPYSVMFDPNMYVHYSADFARRGYAGSSHGCVNVGSLSDAKWIYRNTPVGSKVVVF